MQNITYWHMQVHPTDEIDFAENNLHSLLEHNKIIGMGNWPDGVKNGYIPDFQNKMKVNDIVAIKIGAKLVALVQVIGGYYEIPEDDSDLGWIVFRRPIRILDWEIEEKTLPHTRKTLNICATDDAETTKVIKNWHERVVASLNKRKINLTV